MPATVHSFDDLALRKRARWSRPADPSDRGQFVCRLEQLLRRLGDLHLRISLARLPMRGLEPEIAPLAQAVVSGLQDPCALIGTMPDGSVVAAFLGPRSDDGANGDEAMTRRIRRRFDRALRAAMAESTDPLADLTVVHCWSDEIFDVSSLVLELATVRDRGPAVSNNDRPASSRRA